MNYKEIKALYLDYVNNFLTLAKFCEYYDFSTDQGLQILNIGRKLTHTKIKKS